jgi:hypothetical protein
MIDPVTASAAAEAGAKSAGSKAAADMAGASIVNPMTATAATSFPVVMSGVDLPLIAGATNYGTAIGSGLAAAAPAASTILGLTPTQWGQQALFRGGDALLKGIGESRVNDARDSAISRHEQFIMDSLPARDAAFSSALTPFDRANFDQAFANKKAEMISEFDATRPQFTFAQAPDSTPQEVKSDITRRRQEARERTVKPAWAEQP